MYMISEYCSRSSSYYRYKLELRIHGFWRVSCCWNYTNVCTFLYCRFLLELFLLFFFGQFFCLTLQLLQLLLQQRQHRPLQLLQPLSQQQRQVVQAFLLVSEFISRTTYNNNNSDNNDMIWYDMIWYDMIW